MKLSGWFRSDYEWVLNGELLRFALLTGAWTLIALASDALGRAEPVNNWWAGPLAIGAGQLIDYVRGRLPARDA